MDEARAAIQAEMKGIIKNISRIDKPYCKSVDLDFKIDGPGQYTHLDVKHPVGSKILKRQGQTKGLMDMAYDIGKRQKNRFCGLLWIGTRSEESEKRFTYYRFRPCTPA